MPRTKRVANAFLDFYVEEDTAYPMLFALLMQLRGASLYWFLRREVEPFLKLRAIGRFAQEGDDAVGQWAPLKESTQSFRESMQDVADIAPDHPINIRTQEMFGFVTRGLWEVNEGADSAVLYGPGRTGKKWLNLKLATAQVGDPGRNTPARPVLAIGVSDAVHITERLAIWITEGVAKANNMDVAYEAFDG